MTKITPEKNAQSLALLLKDIIYIKDRVDDVYQKLEKNYVTQQEFEPIKKAVYGIITLFLAAVVAAILRLVLVA